MLPKKLVHRTGWDEMTHRNTGIQQLHTRFVTALHAPSLANATQQREDRDTN